MYKCNNIEDFLKLKVGFPYKNLYYNDAQIHKMFVNSQNIKFDDRVVDGEYYTIHNIKLNKYQLLFMNQPRILIHKSSDYDKFEILSDMFQEKNRIKCKFFSAPMTPEEYFFKNKKELAMKLLNKKQDITPHNLREILYENIKECSAFKVSNMIYLIKLFNVKSVLDPSSGWGDRLLGALATDIRYVGVDPNTLLHADYEKIINFFKHTKKITMLNSTIQDVKLPNEKFDMVLTSPPYFKIEKYSNYGEVKDKNEHEWFNNFMIPMIDKSIKYINNNGHLVMIINQLPNENYVKKLIDYVYTYTNMVYLGVISYSDVIKTNPQPMWIWQKCKKIPDQLYNPEMIISSYKYNKINFNVFRDDFLIGGTKQRGLIPMIAKIKESNIVYASPPQGYAQIALSFAAKLTHKNVKLFINKLPQKTNLTKYAESFGNTTVYELNATLDKLQQEANKLKDSNHYIISFGADDPLFIKELYNSLKKIINIQPKCIWLVAGSATILKVLYKIFPKTFFNVVQVGKKIWPDQLESNRTKLYISSEKFYDIAEYQPPYPTVGTYDAKLWVFFMKYGQNGDYIWNVGKDIN